MEMNWSKTVVSGRDYIGRDGSGLIVANHERGTGATLATRAIWQCSPARPKYKYLWTDWLVR